ncbi:PH domain-containing protein [Nocardioides marmoribigeumensis]|jgi:hypothetical protein|uniref:YdbS-like PH domain-containing protein n=1 Tax=Nocardioides marmoribigeumensis TaxID=433649 RepID=A0ABU2BZ55_9ACTN|nr:PH domain-containing protein [Nocardioides marmoribigeumensis]MDR7363654.1 hypothetical protein [Nocardioides marmoribigeumensis]
MALRLELRPRHRIEDQLLEQLGEEIVRAMPHHPIAFLRGGLWLLLSALWTVAVMITNGPVGALLPVFLFLLRGGWLLLAVYEDWFVITDMRIFRIRGVLNQRAAAMSLSRIVDFTMEQPLMGQLLGYGHFVFENAAQDQGLREIRMLRDVVAVNNLIQQLVFEAGGGPAKHKRGKVPESVAVAPGAEGGPLVPQEPLGDPVVGWGTYDDPDATGQIPHVRDED